MIIAGLLFSLLLITASYTINRYLLGGKLAIDAYQLTLTSASVVVLALTAESLVNPLYTAWIGEKLWLYQVYPRHDGNVSALGLPVWAAYGVHLYFTRQMLMTRLPVIFRNNAVIAIIIGIEAPLIQEVLGNLLFLQLVGEYYAYYLPADIFHLTSLRVVPIYIVCIFAGLFILDGLNRLPRRTALPPAFFSAGIAYLLLG